MLNVILQEGKHSKANKSKSNSTHSYETKIENTQKVHYWTQKLNRDRLTIVEGGCSEMSLTVGFRPMEKKNLTHQ